MANRLIPLKIEVVSTGNELLDGSISDTNSQRLAAAIRPLGLQISRVTIVPDDEFSITHALTEAASRSDVIVVSGGLGPTSDDITLEVAAKSFGSKLVPNKQAKEIVLRRLKQFQRKPNAGHLKQMEIPAGAKALTNHEGSAPGVQWQLGDRTIFFLAGVPREYQFVLDHHLIPFLNKLSSGVGEYLFVLKTFWRPESELNEMMKKMKVPDGVTVGYRTHLPENHLKLFVNASSYGAAKRKIQPLLKKLRKELGQDLFDESGLEYEKTIFQKLLQEQALVSVAESCTGGLVSAMITRVPGSSVVLDRSFITYSNEAKIDMLGVKKETLEKFGAVSKEVALQMVAGALKNSMATKAVAVTGIAGPTGGSKKKPVGTVWIAAATRKKVNVKLFQFKWNSRELIQKFSAYYALQMLRDV